MAPFTYNEALDLIKKSIKGKRLKKEDFRKIFQSMLENKLPDVALAAFVLRQEYIPFSPEETADLTLAMVEIGKTVDFGPNTVDKHSIGGVPGNKVSLLIVPIIASTGLKIPKTSSRSITTIGTADTMEVLAPVALRLDEVEEVVRKTNGCIVWGGALDIAPVDDILIRKVERVLGIDPVSQMVASIMSKKLAMGAKYLVLDIPQGRGTKAETMDEAIKLSRIFTEISYRLGIRLEAAITYGDQPVGHAVGPALEAREALTTLEGNIVSTSLVEKATGLAGILLEMTGKAPPGKGQDIAKEILRSGKALKKMKEIIEAQGGDPKIKSDEVPVGQYTADIEAPVDGYIVSIDNRSIMAIAKAAGAPDDKGAGLVIHKKGGNYVKKGETLITIYSNSESRLESAIAVARTTEPIVVEGMIRKIIHPSMPIHGLGRIIRLEF
ncbi:MAG: AMP phosphorylase [Candidatus Njordarchaeum guaymaensis]